MISVIGVWTGGRDIQKPTQFSWDHNDDLIDSTLHRRMVFDGIETCVYYHYHPSTQQHFLHAGVCSAKRAVLCEIISRMFLLLSSTTSQNGNTNYIKTLSYNVVTEFSSLLYNKIRYFNKFWGHTFKKPMTLRIQKKYFYFEKPGRNSTQHYLSQVLYIHN